MPFITITGLVWRSRERAASSSRNSISSITTCEGGQMGGRTGGWEDWKTGRLVRLSIPSILSAAPHQKSAPAGG